MTLMEHLPTLQQGMHSRDLIVFIKGLLIPGPISGLFISASIEQASDLLPLILLSMCQKESKEATRNSAPVDEVKALKMRQEAVESSLHHTFHFLGALSKLGDNVDLGLEVVANEYLTRYKQTDSQGDINQFLVETYRRLDSYDSRAHGIFYLELIKAGIDFNITSMNKSLLEGNMLCDAYFLSSALETIEGETQHVARNVARSGRLIAASANILLDLGKLVGEYYTTRSPHVAALKEKIVILSKDPTLTAEQQERLQKAISQGRIKIEEVASEESASSASSSSSSASAGASLD